MPGPCELCAEVSSRVSYQGARTAAAVDFLPRGLSTVSQKLLG